MERQAFAGFPSDVDALGALEGLTQLDPLAVPAASESNDFRLIDQALAGDTTAFATLVRPYLQLFTAGIHRILQDDQDTQDTFEQALQSIRAELPSYAEERKFPAWAYGICLDKAVRVRRVRMRRKEVNRQGFLPRFASGDC